MSYTPLVSIGKPVFLLQSHLPVFLLATNPSLCSAHTQTHTQPPDLSAESLPPLPPSPPLLGWLVLVISKTWIIQETSVGHDCEGPVD